MARSIRPPKAKRWTFRYSCNPENIEELLRARKEDFQYMIAAEYRDEEVDIDILAGYAIFNFQKRSKNLKKILDVEGRPAGINCVE